MPAETTPSPFKDMQLTPDQLRELVEQQHRRIQKLETQVERLQEEIDRLRGSKGGSEASAAGEQAGRKRGRPGRKPGQGRFTRRMAAAPESVTANVEACVETTVCPQCGGELVVEQEEVASVTDLPLVVRPEVTMIRVAVCRCARCGRQERGKHPLLAPDQCGATAHRLGPRVMAAAHVLKYGLGLPVCKAPAVLQALCGIRVTASALTQDSLKRAHSAPPAPHRRGRPRAKRPEAAPGAEVAPAAEVAPGAMAGAVGAVYEQLRGEMKEAPVVHTDDTGWKVGGQRAHLMLFESPSSAEGPVRSVYQIRSQHRHEQVQEIIPADYQGILTSDRGSSYDARELAGLKMQKCLAHIQRSIRAAIEQPVLLGSDRKGTRLNPKDPALLEPEDDEELTELEKFTELEEGIARKDREQAVRNRAVGVAFLEELRRLLRWACALHREYHDNSSPYFRAVQFPLKRHRLLKRLGEHLGPRKLPDRAAQTLLDRLGKLHRKGHLIRFLFELDLETTNNRAERARRGPVIARKLSYGSRTTAGAYAFSAFSSVVRTLHLRGCPDLAGALLDVFQSGMLPSVNQLPR
ncbi:MAG TPA: transposase [Armatimonadota bacterium]|nr:transposase [Armatimonadota bacterium]